jgi:hypothetical protein
MKIAVIGNCQVVSLAKILSVYLVDSQCKAFHVNKSSIIDVDCKMQPINLNAFDLIFMNKFDSDWGYLSSENFENNDKVIFIPPIVFRGNQPDFYYLNYNGALLNSALGPYHSSIIVNSWLEGLTQNECMSLFDPIFYKFLGFDEIFISSVLNLKKLINSYDYDSDLLVDRWVGGGCFMHTINHPKIKVLVDLIEHICNKYSLNTTPRENVLDLVVDNLKSSVIIPVYPSLHGSNSNKELLFKQPDTLVDKNVSCTSIINCRNLISLYYASYNSLDKLALSEATPKINQQKFNEALVKYRNFSSTPFKHPYKKLPDSNYWSRSISKVSFENVDPVVNFDFKITPSCKVATAGSCFAQHIARTLAKSGMNYFVAEKGDLSLDDEVLKELGYGLFSARYGNIYTAKQLLQLFDRAFGEFVPEDNSWITKDCKFIDPYRPNIGESFDSAEALENDRELHFEKVREMFINLDIFVFTLGLTETWQNVCDGSVYPVAPGIISKNEDKHNYKFINCEYNDVLNDMHRFIMKLRGVNPHFKMILTVSPVPLAATAENRSVLLSTTLSKSILRSVADKLSNTYNFVSYFPSFEIITGNFNRGQYFANNLRDVVDKGVDHVMSLFMKHCTTKNTIVVNKTHVAVEVDNEFEQLTKVICDEDLIEE